MGRSRPIPHSNDDFRSNGKKAPSGAENGESVTPGEGSKSRKTALYHCNYCNKDITGMVRFKCAQCPDFDLCVECFSVGAEVYPHKNNHPYRVMDNLSFPIICPDWNADEEILLLEGIAIYGFSNWAEVAEHVGTKTKSECIDHYDSAYMNSPCFPLPDLSLAVGKKKEELQAMAKEHDELQKSLEDASPNEELPYSEKWRAAKKPYSDLEVKDGGHDIKVKDTFSDRKVGEKKPKMGEGPSVAELSGYNPKRHEFEVEYDNDAEQLLADMEFHETDTEAETKLKLKIIKIYNRRLDERERRKNFVIERNLLHPDPFEATLSPEEKEICQRYRVFMRFHSKEDHQELLKTVVEEHRILKKIQELEEAKAAGCRSSAEAQIYFQQKRKLEAEENAVKMKETIVPGSGGKLLLRPGQHHQSGTSSTAPGQPTASSLNDWNVSGFPGADLLSEMDKRLCREMKILPAHYLNMLQTIAMEVLKGNITKKSDAHQLFQVEPSKVDRVYDMLVKKGIAPK